MVMKPSLCIWLAALYLVLSFKAKIAELDLCHPAVWMVKNDSLNVLTFKPLAKALECARHVILSNRAVPNELMSRPILRIALHFWTNKLICAIRQIRLFFKSCHMPLVVRADVAGDPPDRLFGFFVISDTLEQRRLFIAFAQLPALIEFATSDHAACSIKLTGGVPFPGKHPFAARVNLRQHAAAAAVPIALK